MVVYDIDALSTAFANVKQAFKLIPDINNENEWGVANIDDNKYIDNNDADGDMSMHSESSDSNSNLSHSASLSLSTSSAVSSTPTVTPPQPNLIRRSITSIFSLKGSRGKQAEKDADKEKEKEKEMEIEKEMEMENDVDDDNSIKNNDAAMDKNIPSETIDPLLSPPISISTLPLSPLPPTTITRPISSSFISTFSLLGRKQSAAKNEVIENDVKMKLEADSGTSTPSLIVRSPSTDLGDIKSYMEGNDTEKGQETNIVEVDFMHCFAVKSCPLPYVLHRAVSEGLGLECASIMEVRTKFTRQSILFKFISYKFCYNRTF